ncbi:glutathione S-transferase [Sorangium cellulosum]|uniref:Glutathione S-transferase n=1 Tax=Sorangium cellulosum TaxID=56 RepID=A0A2L0F4Z5_SORCE|nr:glutathione transferase GstA [Sorangium cellulosum]AUX46509.1 glutathione S-transferase [Sorangium cellulosum]
MKLYYTPGACSLSPHIALRESGLSFELEQVDLKAKKLKDGGDYLAVNPKGYVPALALDSGEVLTEGAIIVQYIADKVPASKLAPAAGTTERLRLQEWLHFIATELHKGFGPINHPKSSDELKQAFRERLEARFAILSKGLEGKSFLLGDTFTVADGYAFYTLRNLRRLDEQALDRSPALKGYFERVGARPAVKAALAAEGLS